MATRERNLELAKELVDALRKAELFITTVESCTGGGLAYYVTNIPGASDVMKDSFITYSNEAKLALGVPEQTIRSYTVYSQETALAMANAGRLRSVRADVSVGITGSISRVDPQNPNSKPGQVYVAVMYGQESLCRTLNISPGKRIDVKDEIIEKALQMALEIINKKCLCGK